MKVMLTYFHLRGKYYAEGEYETDAVHMFQIFEQVDRLRRERKLPGLIEGHSPFIVLVDVPDHEHNHPVLLGVPGAKND